MSEQEIAQVVRGWLISKGGLVAKIRPKTETSGTVHLEVWKSSAKPFAFGLELGHLNQVNFWVEKRYGIRIDRMSIGRTEKDLSASSKGANSNLGGYELLKRRKLTRLEVFNVEDALFVLDFLS